MDKQKLIGYLDNAYPLRSIAEAENLGLSTVRYWIKKYQLKPVGKTFSNWDIEKIRELALTATSKREILAALGMRDTGSIYTTLEKVARENGIALPTVDMSKLMLRLSSAKRGERLDRLVKDSSLKGPFIVKILREELEVPYECSRCKLTNWLGEPIVLEVDHIDGDHRNNLPTNLRFLCPNCHSLTPTNSRIKPRLKTT